MKTPPLTPALTERWKQGLPVTLPQLAAVQSDSARYRQIGNAVTVNVAEWIGGRISNQRKEIE